MSFSPPQKGDDIPVVPADNRHQGAFGANQFLDITALIRSLQRAEGERDCFRKDRKDCDDKGCAWRLYCMNRHSNTDCDII
jgi:hypothetical protein